MQVHQSVLNQDGPRKMQNLTKAVQQMKNIEILDVGPGHRGLLDYLSDSDASVKPTQTNVGQGQQQMRMEITGQKRVDSPEIKNT